MPTQPSVDVVYGTADAASPDCCAPRRQLLCDAGVRFLSDLPRSRQVVDFAVMSCDRLNIVDTIERERQLDELVLRDHFGDRLVAMLTWDERTGRRSDTAILADAAPANYAAITRQLNGLERLLTAEDRERITIEIVPRWSHDRPAIVSPLALYDSPDTTPSSARSVVAGTAADG